MHNLQHEQKRLIEVIQTNATRESQNIFQLYFHWWRLLLYTNQNIEKVSDKEAKSAIIEDFMIFHRSMEGDVQSVAEHLNYDPSVNPPEIEIDNPAMPPNIQKIMKMFIYEMQRFKRLSRETQRSEKVTKKSSRIKRRSKWLSG